MKLLSSILIFLMLAACGPSDPGNNNNPNPDKGPNKVGNNGDNGDDGNNDHHEPIGVPTDEEYFSFSFFLKLTPAQVDILKKGAKDASDPASDTYGKFTTYADLKTALNIDYDAAHAALTTTITGLGLSGVDIDSDITITNGLIHLNLITKIAIAKELTGADIYYYSDSTSGNIYKAVNSRAIVTLPEELENFFSASFGLMPHNPIHEAIRITPQLTSDIDVSQLDENSDWVASATTVPIVPDVLQNQYGLLHTNLAASKYPLGVTGFGGEFFDYHGNAYTDFITAFMPYFSNPPLPKVVCEFDLNQFSLTDSTQCKATPLRSDNNSAEFKFTDSGEANLDVQYASAFDTMLRPFFWSARDLSATGTSLDFDFSDFLVGLEKANDPTYPPSFPKVFSISYGIPESMVSNTGTIASGCKDEATALKDDSTSQTKKNALISCQAPKIIENTFNQVNVLNNLGFTFVAASGDYGSGEFASNNPATNYPMPPPSVQTLCPNGVASSNSACSIFGKTKGAASVTITWPDSTTANFPQDVTSYFKPEASAKIIADAKTSTGCMDALFTPGISVTNSSGALNVKASDLWAATVSHEGLGYFFAKPAMDKDTEYLYGPDNSQCTIKIQTSIAQNPKGAYGENVTIPIFPGALPNITSVGGTLITTAPTAEQPAIEFVASTMTGATITSGGGFSNYIDGFEESIYAGTYDFQKDVVAKYLGTSWTNNSFNTMDASSGKTISGAYGFNPKGRGFPDVAMLGHYFQMKVYSSSSDSIVAASADGTSASTPIFSALIARLSVDLADANGKRAEFGNLNWLLYYLYDTYCTHTVSEIDCPFVDVKKPELDADQVGTHCQKDGAACLKHGFYVADEWDAATGLGSINYTKLLKAVCNMSFYNDQNLVGCE